MRAIELPNWRVYQREHQSDKRKKNNAAAMKCYYNRNIYTSRKRKRILSITLYDGSLYAKFTTRSAKMQYKLQIECDSLWYKFCSLESLISSEAFKIIERINQIEYLT